MITSRFFSTAGIKGFLKKPQFDVKSIVSNIHLYEKSIRNRGIVESTKVLEELNKLPEIHESERKLNKELAKVQAKRKSVESCIKSDRSTIKELSADIKLLKQQAHSLSNELNAIDNHVLEICSSLPNLIAPSVPLTEPEIVKWLNPSHSNSYAAEESRHHVDIMVKKNMLDLQTASYVSGSSWYYLLNAGAELEQALVSFAIAKAKSAGFQMCIPPSIVKNDVIDACGFRPRDMNNEQQIYHITDTSLGLTATAEISLAGLGINKIIDLSTGPKKLVGLSRSYRSEAGARGRDTKGLYRVHEFTKVELFCWSRPQDSEQLLEQLKNLQQDIVQSLGLTAKVLNMPANDLGAPAFKKYDIESWMPGRGSFGEITSASNCLDFQSRRMNTKFRNEETGKLEYVHTLNGTAMAVPRVIVALVENFYDPTTQKIEIPQCLRKYMDDKEYI